MPAAYSFLSRWDVPATPERCWGELQRMLRPGAVSWWRAVRVAEAPPALGPGSEVVLVVRSPLGYRLRVQLRVTEIVEGRSVAATSTGDLRGAGRLDIVAAAGGSILTWRWDVETGKRWMNAAAPALRPIFVRAHTHVMRRGEAGLRSALARD